MKLHKYHIAPNQLILYPNYNLLIAGRLLLLVLGGMIAVSVVFLTVMAMKNGGSGFSFSNLFYFFPLVFVLPFFIVGAKHLIIDLNQGVVYKKGLFGTRKLIDLKDVEIAETASNNGTFYRLVSKADHYGKGIRISSYYSPHHQTAHWEYCHHVLPTIETYLSVTTAQQDERPVVPQPITTYRYYRVTGQQYRVKKTSLATYGAGFIICLLIFVGMMFGPLPSEYRFMPLLPLVVLTGELSRRKTFDLQAGQLVISYFWVIKTRHNLADFIRFVVVRHTTNGMYDGTELKLLFAAPKNTTKEVALARYNKTKNIEPFMLETRSILEKAGKTIPAE